MVRRGSQRYPLPSPALAGTGARAHRAALPPSDFTLLALAIALALFGLVMVASASLPLSVEHYRSPERLFLRQLIAAFVGFTLLLWLSRLDYRKLFDHDGTLLLVAVGLTLLTFVPALAPNGLWLQLGIFSFQPTELTKLALLVFLAASLVRKEEQGELRHFTTGVLPFYALWAFLSLLAILQPDFALVVVYGAIVAFMLLIAGAPLRHLLGPALAGLPLIALLLWLAPYRRARLLAYLNPFSDPQGSGYHLIQSLIALGSGGLFGQGLGASREKWLYLPSAYNDFIVSIIGEELGLLGTMTVLGLFVALCWRGFTIALHAPDKFGFLLAAGITFALSFQAAINLGVAVGALPVTGLTLPLVSYGGSSLIVSLAMVGLLLSVSRAAVHSPSSSPSSLRTVKGGSFGLAGPAGRRWHRRPLLPGLGAH